MDEELLPYRAEYAKSNRASCRGCKGGIDKDELRLAIMVQSPMFDGRQTNWYHVDCFFKKQRPKAIGDFEHIQSIRYEDQERLKKLIESCATKIIEAPAKGKKRALKASGALKDFTIEYSKSSRATCRGCELKIMKGDIRISKKDFDTEIGRKYGGQDMWHHVDCFAKLRSEMLFYAGADCLPGFPTLSKDDQKTVLQKIPPINIDEVPEVKKIKEEMKDEVDGEEEKAYKKQMKELFDIRDKLKAAFSTKECKDILEYNNQYVPDVPDRALDHLADVIYFGNTKPCPVCKTGQFIFSNDTYKCKGNISEWTKCSNTTQTPERERFQVPEMYKDAEVFQKYKSRLRNRIIKSFVKTVSVKKEVKEENEAKIKREKPPLYNMEFVIHKSKTPKEKLEKQIAKLGGKSVTKISPNTMAVISTKKEMEVEEGKWSSKIKAAQKCNVHVVTEDFLEEIAKGRDYSDVIKANSICDWGSEPATRLPAAPSKSASSSSKSKSIYNKSVSGSVKLKVKGGGAVDPESGLDDIAHVYESGDDKYTVVLGKTDLQRNKNSFYKLQLLKADKGNRFWVFRAWGRIGTTIGGTKVDEMDNLKEAIKFFKFYYTKETGNEWEDRKNFVKKPGMMHPIDVDYGEEIQEAKGLSKSDVTSDSKLAKPVQDLVQMIFDVNTMKKTMAEFELDLEKMPLGKLSKKQIQAAFGVLSELKEVISRPNPPDSSIIDCCNRFYTLIPHDFGVDTPPLIKTEEEIKKKLEMLDNLMELEVAYHMMQAVESGEGQHPIDQYYAQLKTDIEVLDKESEEFKLIEKYVQNTHAETHQQYELEILDVFKVNRHGEDKRFKPFRKLHNRKLLWHGSRLTNFAGILSQGLRIAPPEAPVTGYMFGKGIYFADMVSKSANYCCTNKSNPTGLLLLCEVALGNMYERKEADYIEKLPKGKHSCKGIGRTEPDPKEVAKLEDGVEVPLGKGVKNPKLDSALLYNEYIVYDVAQVKCKYLLKVNFKYKY